MPIRTAWHRVTWLRIRLTTLGSKVTQVRIGWHRFHRLRRHFGALVVQGAPGALLTVREVAARLRVSRATVYRLVQAGALPVLRVSNSIRIPAAALARGALPEQLGMGAQADELEGLRVRLPVDEQEVRP
jgi:excisionase family DNA binding protein